MSAFLQAEFTKQQKIRISHQFFLRRHVQKSLLLNCYWGQKNSWEITVCLMTSQCTSGDKSRYRL